MIITIERHGCRRQDFVKLTDHLLKPENETIEILGIGNSIASDLAGVLEDMEALKDGSAARFGLIHATINPGEERTEEQLLAYANRVRLELDPDGERPWIVVAHRKARAVSQAAHHAHLVLGTISVKIGKALNDYRSKIRTELVARLLEYESQFADATPETPTLGRHHQTVVRFLKDRKLPNVAEWLVERFGEEPELPRSAMSSRSRRRAARLNVDLPKSKAKIAVLWSQTADFSVFREALSSAGYEITPGKKADVWVVVDKNGNTIGALDRLLRLKRRETQQMVEKSNERREAEIESGTRTADRGARAETLQTVPKNQRPGDAIGSAIGIVEHAQFRGGRPDWPDSETVRNDNHGVAGPWHSAHRHRFEGKRYYREFEYRNALRQLHKLSTLMSTSAICAKTGQASTEAEVAVGRQSGPST